MWYILYFIICCYISKNSKISTVRPMNTTFSFNLYTHNFTFVGGISFVEIRFPHQSNPADNTRAREQELQPISVSSSLRHHHLFA